MRVGVFVRSVGATDGGGNSLASSILRALENTPTRHKFILFRQDQPAARGGRSSLQAFRKQVSSHPVFGPAARSLRRSLRALSEPREQLSFEQKCVSETDVDVAWFVGPGATPVPVPYIATVWDLEHRKQPYFPEVSITGWKWDQRELNFRTVLPRAARVLTGTETGKEEIIAFYGVPAANVRVVPHPAADEYRQLPNQRVDIRTKYGLSRPFIFYPAQFWPHKNHRNLVLALRQINSASRPPIDLVLTGSDKGNLAYIRQVIAELDLIDRVHVLGFVPAADIAALYREALALVYPTLFGPDNLPPLEAFASGCPVAASEISGSRDQLGDAALFFDPLDPSSIAGAIDSILRDEVRSELVRRGRELVAERTPQKYVEEICRIIDELEPYRRCWGRDYIHI